MGKDDQFALGVRVSEMNIRIGTVSFEHKDLIRTIEKGTGLITFTMHNHLINEDMELYLEFDPNGKENCYE